MGQGCLTIYFTKDPMYIFHNLVFKRSFSKAGGPFSGSLVELVTFWWLVKTTSAIGQADIGH